MKADASVLVELRELQKEMLWKIVEAHYAQAEFQYAVSKVLVSLGFPGKGLCLECGLVVNPSKGCSCKDTT